MPGHAGEGVRQGLLTSDLRAGDVPRAETVLQLGGREMSGGRRPGRPWFPRLGSMSEWSYDVWELTGGVENV